MADSETEREQIDILVKRDYRRRRLDAYLATRFPQHSRTYWQHLIRGGYALVNGRPAKPSYAIQKGDLISLSLEPLPPSTLQPEAMPLSILYEDPYLIVLNKPAGLVVHPAPGHLHGTLIQGVLHHVLEEGAHLSEGSAADRPGIVHRLDKDTSGLIVMAKEERAHRNLARQFEYRQVEKTYVAIVRGEVNFDSDYVELPLGPHPQNRLRTIVRKQDGKQASTFYQVVERYRGYTFVRAHPKTGRTHQIRVHLSAIGHPLVGDALYGGPLLVARDIGATELPAEESVMDRQALHAEQLTFLHPQEGRKVTFQAPWPDDLDRLVALLRKYRSRPGRLDQ